MGERGLASVRHIVQVRHEGADSLSAAAKRLLTGLIAGHEEIEMGRVAIARTIAQDLQTFTVFDGHIHDTGEPRIQRGNQRRLAR